MLPHHLTSRPGACGLCHQLESKLAKTQPSREFRPHKTGDPSLTTSASTASPAFSADLLHNWLYSTPTTVNSYSLTRHSTRVGLRDLSLRLTPGTRHRMISLSGQSPSACHETPAALVPLPVDSHDSITSEFLLLSCKCHPVSFSC